MDVALCNQIMQLSSFGYTYNKIILNDDGKPVDYIFLETNPAYEKMLGLQNENVLNRKISEVYDGVYNDSFDWIGCFGKVALTGESIEFEEYSRNLNRWFHMSVISPGPMFFVVLSFDITEKKRTEIRLRLSEQRNRLYINSAPDGIFIADRNYQYLEVNPAACTMLGYSHDELLKLHITDVIPSEETVKHQDSMDCLYTYGRSSRKALLKRKDGSKAVVMIDTVILENDDLMAFCKDISSQEKIAVEKTQYYEAFQSMLQPVLITDAAGSILSINQSMSEMYGYSEGEAVGKNPHILNPGRNVYESLGVSQLEYDSLFSELWKAVRNPAVRTWEGIVINKKKNGSLVWVNLVINGVYNEQGELSRIIGLPIDITHSHELEDTNRIQLYQTIADLAELRDDDTGNHMKRVGIFAKLLAREYGMNKKYCNDIEIFAPMHDIGKVGILDSILRAPRRLTADEFAIMKTHTILGHNIVKGKKEFAMTADITLSHHERFDGTGYPNGLSGEVIPLAARITAIADVYDALRSKRSYKDSWSQVETVKFMIEGSGTHFDPNLISLFVNLSDQFDVVFHELGE